MTKQNNQSSRLRLSVFRSNKYIYGQIIDDVKSCTVAAVSPHEFKKTDKKQQVEDSAKLLAERATKAGVKRIFLDRRSYKYQGRVKMFADILRKEGLEF